MHALLIAALFAMPHPQDGCIDFSTSIDLSDQSPPLQPSGAGLWIGGMAFTRGDIASAEPDREPMTNAWGLTVRFTPQGNQKFLRAQRCGIGKPMEISFDRVVLSRPWLNEKIIGGTASLLGGWQSREEVEAMAKRIMQH